VAGHRFEETLSAAQRGDEDAFRSLFRAVQPGLLRYLGVLAGPVAEDVAADTWVSVVRDLHKFRGDESGFGAWVFTIARARLHDEQRRVCRRPTPVGDDLLLLEPAPRGLDPAEQAVQAAGTATALALLATLPRDQAEAVLLRHVVGFDVARTAKILGKRPGAVRVACHRGLARLRAELAESGAPPGAAVTKPGLRAVEGMT
jgi:RNA polymerase sigma-70 factor (ECF subfamily)